MLIPRMLQTLTSSLQDPMSHITPATEHKVKTPTNYDSLGLHFLGQTKTSYNQENQKTNYSVTPVKLHV